MGFQLLQDTVRVLFGNPNSSGIATYSFAMPMVEERLCEGKVDCAKVSCPLSYYPTQTRCTCHYKTSNIHHVVNYVVLYREKKSPDSKIYVWGKELDAFRSFDFATGLGSGAHKGDKESPDIMNRAQQAAEIAGRRPLAQFWDPTEPKLLVCEAVHIPLTSAKLSLAAL